MTHQFCKREDLLNIVIDISNLYNNLLHKYLFSRASNWNFCTEQDNLLYKYLFSIVSHEEFNIEKVDILNSI